MGLFNFGGLDVGQKVADFEALLTGIRDNLETLIELHRPPAMEPAPEPFDHQTAVDIWNAGHHRDRIDAQEGR